MKEQTMPKPKQSKRGASAVSYEELREILGEIDDRKAFEILALGPTVEDLEEAAKWAGGEGEIVGKAGHPLVGRAAEIFDILTADEEEEPPPAA
jgi:hypothetical protein